MKYTYLFVSCFLFVWVGCSSYSGYKISGTIEHLNGMVYLVFPDSEFPVDSTESKEGQFTFTGVLPEVSRAAIILKNDSRMVSQFFLENTHVFIRGNLNNLQDIIVEGSETDALFRTEFPRYCSSVDSMILYVKKYPSSASSAYVLSAYLSRRLSVSETESLISTLSRDLQGGTLVRQVQKTVDRKKRIEVGQPYLEIALPDTSGHVLSLSEVVARGGYVLIDFWASDNLSCQAEHAYMVTAYKRYKDKGFTVFSVSLDLSTEKALWIKSIEKEDLTWEHVSDLNGWDSPVVYDYFIDSIPQNILIAPGGKIVARNLRGDALLKKLADIYAEQEIQQPMNL